MNKINLAVVFGGRSVEHEVAIISGVQAMNNLNKDKYNILPIYLGKDGEMLYSPDFINIDTFKHISLSTLKEKYPSVILNRIGDEVCLVEMK